MRASSLLFTNAHCTPFTMIRQRLLRQSRSIISPVPSHSISQLHSPFRLRHLQPLSSAFAKPFPPRVERRWVSAETDAEAKTNPDPESVSTRGAAADQQTQAEDPLKKDLETKNREIIDLKVCHMSTRLISTVFQLYRPQTPSAL
jgi:molecular chaperone GrpE